jgi:hypothetical protein
MPYVQRRLSRAGELVDVIEPDRHLQAEALQVTRGVACQLYHPIYDCLYLALPCGWLSGCSPERFFMTPHPQP